MTYEFDITLHPYGDGPDAGVVRLDTKARYGYWEYRNGSEGGGLWFEPVGPLELVDYDGGYFLPPAVIRALRAAGVSVDPEYFPESLKA